MDWRHRAACKDEDPELFFPVSEGGASRAQITEAKSVCGRCPVTSECEAHGREVSDDFGIRAGRTAKERRGLTRTRG